MKKEKCTNKHKGIKLGSIIYFLAICAMCGVIIFNIYIRTIGGDQKVVKTFGMTPTVVMSGSMLPAIEIGALGLVETCTAEDVDVDDIIVYRSETRGINIIHRVIDKFTYGGIVYITTKGDNNEEKDREYITNDNIIGKVNNIYNWTAPIMRSMMYPDGSGINQNKLFILITSSFLVIILFVHGVVLLLHKIISLKVGQKRQEDYK